MQKAKKTDNKTDSAINFGSKKLLNLYKLNQTNSNVCCHARPSGKEIKFFKNVYKINFVLTLQFAKENPNEIGKICRENNIGWQLIEITGANMSNFRNPAVQKAIHEGLVEICNLLKSQNINLFIHCAAGLHRTGTILYSILRIFGESPDSAMKTIGYVREETFKNVGDLRIKYAEECIVPKLIKSLYGDQEKYEMIFSNKNQIIIKDDIKLNNTNSLEINKDKLNLEIVDENIITFDKINIAKDDEK